MYVHPRKPEKGVCGSGVKNRGWGWYSGQSKTPSGKNETPSCQWPWQWPIYMKSGQKCSRIGGKEFNHFFWVIWPWQWPIYMKSGQKFTRIGGKEFNHFFWVADLTLTVSEKSHSAL